MTLSRNVSLGEAFWGYWEDYLGKEGFCFSFLPLECSLLYFGFLYFPGGEPIDGGARFQGTLKSFSAASGYGFIASEKMKERFDRDV